MFSIYLDKVTHRKWLRKTIAKQKKTVRRANEQKGKLMRLYEAYCVFC